MTEALINRACDWEPGAGGGEAALTDVGCSKTYSLSVQPVRDTSIQ